MTDDSDRSPWFPPAMFTEGCRRCRVYEQVAESQQEMMKQLLQATSANPLENASAFGPMNMGTATFKARVQSGGRISIPGPERKPSTSKRAISSRRSSFLSNATGKDQS